MRAAQLYGTEDVRIENLADLQPSDPAWPNRVLVDVEWCGLCGSDLHGFTHGPVFPPTWDVPHPLTGEKMPMTMGHEFCGTVKAVPKGSKFAVGDRVVAEPSLTCGKCFCCLKGWTSQCSQLGFVGLSGSNGGLSETVGVDEGKLYRIPDGLETEFAALCEPLSVARHALRKANVGEDDWEDKTVLVLGGGPVGYATIVNLCAFGVKSGNIFVSEPTTKRRQMLQKFGHTVLNPLVEDVGARCMTLTGGDGVDIVFDCAGIPKALEDGLHAIKPRGTYVNVAIWMQPMTIPFPEFFKKEIVITSSHAYNAEDFQSTIDLMAQGKYNNFKEMVTRRVLLEEVVQKGFCELMNHQDDHIKILVTPKASNLK